MVRQFILLIMTSLMGNNRNLPSFNALPGAYQWKYQTTAHQLLSLEEQYSQSSPENKRQYYDPMYAKVDQLMDAATERLDRYKTSSRELTRQDAVDILRTIDSVLTEQHFVVCILTEKLSDGLTAKKLEEFACDKFLYGYRAEFCERNRNANYFGVDCDLGAILYLSIGEVLHFPLALVEIPGHNFVRWRFADNSYINFDNNTGDSYSDDSFRKGLTPTSSTRFTAAEELGCHFLVDMSGADVRAYYLTIIAIFISHQGRYQETEHLYKEAIRVRPYDVLAMNNLAWMYLTVPEYNNPLNYGEAYKLSARVDELLPSSIEYRDTYSCACAGIGDFGKALAVEKTARNKNSRITGYNKRLSCLDIGEKLW